MLEHGLVGRGVANHARAVGLYARPTLERLAGLAPRAGLGFVSDPHTGPLHLPVRELTAMGVPVALGQDDIEDAYYPFGRHNMLEIAFLAAHALEAVDTAGIDLVYDAVTTTAARVLGVTGHRLEVGGNADLVVHHHATLREVVGHHDAPAYVVASGTAGGELHDVRHHVPLREGALHDPAQDPDRHRHRRHVHRRRRLRRGHRRAGHHQDAVDAEQPGRRLPGRHRQGARPARRGPARTIDAVSHGTTVATNQLLEGKVDRLGFITTEGYEAMLEIARQSVPDGYGNSYFWVKPDRIVPRDLVKGVGGRLDFTGAEVRPFDEDGARAVARWFRRRASTRSASASCTPTPTPTHEERMREILAEEHPDAVVSLSSEVLREYREYERAMTTLVDAAVKPRLSAYVTQHQDPADGLRRPRRSRST